MLHQFLFLHLLSAHIYYDYIDTVASESSRFHMLSRLVVFSSKERVLHGCGRQLSSSSTKLVIACCFPLPFQHEVISMPDLSFLECCLSRLFSLPPLHFIVIL